MRTRGPWLALAAALVVASPNLIWDASRGFPSLGFQLAHGFGVSASASSPIAAIELLGAQIGLLTPVVAALVVAFLVRGSAPAPGGRFLKALGLIPLAVFTVAALFARPEANWPAPALAVLLAGTVAWLGQPGAEGRGGRRGRLARPAVAVALVTSALATGLGAAHLLRPLPWLPAAEEPAARLRAWDDLPPWLGREPIVADGYELAAALSFALPDHPETVDGRRRGLPLEGPFLIVAAGLGDEAPPAPSWAARSGECLAEAGTHPMRRRDGQVVRTLRAFRRVPCSSADEEATSE